MSSNFQKEVKDIKEKCSKANLATVHVTIMKETKMMKWLFQLFEIQKKILFLQVPFCEGNEKRSKSFLNKFYIFTNEKFKLIVG